MSLTSAHSRCIMVDDEDAIYFFSASFLFYLDIPMIVAKTCFIIYILVMRLHVLREGAKRGNLHVKMMGIFPARLMDVTFILVLQYLDVSHVRVLLNSTDERLIAYVLFCE